MYWKYTEYRDLIKKTLTYRIVWVGLLTPTDVHRPRGDGYVIAAAK